MAAVLAEAGFFARMGVLLGSEVAQNCVIMAFTQALSAGLGSFAGPDSQRSAGYAAEQADCEQVTVMQQQAQQLTDLAGQAENATGDILAGKMRQLRSATLAYAQSMANEQRRFRTRASIAIIVNIYITLMLLFWVLRKTQRRHGTLSHAEIDLSILEAARRDAALAASLQAAAGSSAIT